MYANSLLHYFIECDLCTSPAHICDSDTGRCICPKNSRGIDCQQCFPHTWGYEFQKGCKQCDCNTIGSAKQDCDVYTGQCHCKEGFAGKNCEHCAPGHYGYPNCHKCNCDPRGSVSDEYGTIHCDDNGQCPCRHLVTGIKCDTCKSSAFGLSSINADGCTRCFCFGRSQQCYQSEMHWGQIRMMGPRNLTVQYITNYRSIRQDYEFVYVSHIKNNKIYREAAEIKNINGLNVLPSPTGNITIGSNSAFYYPLYFQLSKQFLGDKIASYGGSLNFSILTEGCSSNLRESILRQYPVVQLHTHHKLILDYYEVCQIFLITIK
jgi:laminin alpha 1/2